MPTADIRQALRSRVVPTFVRIALVLSFVACSVDDRLLGAADSGAASDDAASDAASDAAADVGTTLADDATVMAEAGGPQPCVTGDKRQCADDPQSHALGNCAQGVETCTGGVWSACSVLPALADSCATGDDANCNGTKNDGCSCVDGSKQSCGPSLELGECRRGTQTCVASKWGECVGAVLARARDCTSGLDFDCDGVPDNKIDAVCKCAAGTSQECNGHPGLDGKGPCRPGTQTCVVASDKKSSAFGACSGAQGPAASDGCDSNSDNNCNGIPNEGCPCVNGATQPCGPAVAVGICKPGVQTCAATQWGACVGAVFATGRDCSKMTDNDCNGAPDQGEAACECVAGTMRDCTTTRQGPCKPGKQTCQLATDKKSTSWDACSGLAPAVKDGCNPGDDSNCNGIANEGCGCVNGTSKPCGDDTGVCQKGTQTCVNSTWGACEGQVTARTRDCTSANDNDCNGMADNAEAPCTACTVGSSSCMTGLKGACATGTRTCSLAADKSSASLGNCIAPPAAAKDGCNPKDDANCDGTVGGGCCVGGGACVGANPCHKYALVCNSSGQTVCTDSGQSSADGTACGTAMRCWSGLCCGSGQRACGGACTDIFTDANNCGACGAKCSPTASGMIAQCRNRECVSVWDANSAQCGGGSGWLGCQGTGCLVCSDGLAGYPLYTRNHPSCLNNSTCEAGAHYNCSDVCPAPSSADTCGGSEGGWQGCRGNGCSVCSELVDAYSKYLQHHPYCVRNTSCEGSFGTCNSNCPQPTEEDR
jgi:hypothetical protein